MRFLTVLCTLAVLGTLLQVDGAGAAGGGKRKKSLTSARTRKAKGKPQADAPLPSKGDDEFEDYDATYYDEDYDGTAAGAGESAGPNLGPQPNANDNGAGEETTEVFRQPDDELPTGGHFKIDNSGIKMTKIILTIEESPRNNVESVQAIVVNPKPGKMLYILSIRSLAY